MVLIDTSALLHEPMIDYWRQEYQEWSILSLESQFDRAAGLGRVKQTSGDVHLQRIQDIFMYGFGIEWSSVQLKVFKALIDSILPLIYKEEWEEVKGRVMAQRKMDKMKQETLVNMARRNGKTWVVSGGAAAVYLGLPGATFAVFSVGKRQANMFMASAVEKIELAFKRGTHVNASGYNLITRNQEMIVYEHPEGGKQVLGCYPGSTKVGRLLCKDFSFPGKVPLFLFFFSPNSESPRSGLSELGEKFSRVYFRSTRWLLKA